VAVRNHVDPKQHDRSKDAEPKHPHRIARSGRQPIPGVVIGRVFLLITLRPHQDRDSDHGGKQDVFLAHRVKAPVVERHSSHEVRRMPLPEGHTVERLAVDAVIAAEVGEACEAPQEKGCKSN